MRGNILKLSESRSSAISKQWMIAVRGERVEPPFDTLRANGIPKLIPLMVVLYPYCYPVFSPKLPCKAAAANLLPQTASKLIDLAF